jgi:hypothetical protein
MGEWLLDLRGSRSEADYAPFLKPFATIVDTGANKGRDVLQLARLRPHALSGRCSATLR